MNTTTDTEGRSVHPADKYGRPNGGERIPLTKVLAAVDAELAKPVPAARVVRHHDEYGTLIRADSRLEEISRLLLSLPFGEMLKLAEEMVKSAPPLEEGKAELPDHIRMAMSLDVWAKSKMEERDGSVRETPTAK